jgi:AAT family amino acid transporter
VIPIVILVSIFPSSEAGLEGSVFATALARHGFGWAGTVLSLVVLVAALSCANSGIYGTTRALYALAKEGLAPRGLGALNRNQVPQNATLATIVLCWAFVPMFTLFKGTAFYTWLLSVSGFTGAVCWISISWCQIRFRRRVRARGYRDEELRFAAPLYPVLSWAAVWLQIACLVLVALHPTLRACLVIGVPSLVVPMVVVQLLRRRGLLAQPPLPPDEKSLDELYPAR